MKVEAQATTLLGITIESRSEAAAFEIAAADYADTKPAGSVQWRKAIALGEYLFDQQLKPEFDEFGLTGDELHLVQESLHAYPERYKALKVDENSQHRFARARRQAREIAAILVEYDPDKQS